MTAPRSYEEGKARQAVPHDFVPMPLTKDDKPDHKCGPRCACVECFLNQNHPIHSKKARS